MLNKLSGLAVSAAILLPSALFPATVFAVESSLSASDAAGADASWQQLEDVSINKTARYRELGLEFFERYPTDPRRWEWLLKTFGGPFPYFVRQSESARQSIDSAAMKKWDERVRSEFRPAFMAS